MSIPQDRMAAQSRWPLCPGWKKFTHCSLCLSHGPPQMASVTLRDCSWSSALINTTVSANFWTMSIATTGGNIVIKAGWVRTEEPHTLWRWMASSGVDFYNNSRDMVSFMLPLSWSRTGPHAGCSSWNHLLLSPLDFSDSRSFTPNYCTSSQREWKSGRGSKATVPRG